jgi:transcriptional regulator with XRE-family HTH domain
MSKKIDIAPEKGMPAPYTGDVPDKPLLAKHLKRFRTMLEITQDELASKLGVSRHTIIAREQAGNENHILPPREQLRLWQLMVEASHNPWIAEHTEEDTRMSGTYNDFTENMGGSQKDYKELAKFFDTLVAQPNEIDRAALINISNPDRAPGKSVLAASTVVNNGREVDDDFLLQAVHEVLAKEKDPHERDRETSFPLHDGLYFSSRLYDNKNYKMVFVSADDTELAFEASIQANYVDIGTRFRLVLSKLSIRLNQ